MHWPRKGPALRGAVLLLLSRLTAVPAVRALVLRIQLRDTRIRELPERW